MHVMHWDEEKDNRSEVLHCGKIRNESLTLNIIQITTAALAQLHQASSSLVKSTDKHC